MANLSKSYQYRQPFKQWDVLATVRSSPPRRLHPEEGKVYYAPELEPLAQHPVLIERGLSHTLLIERLYSYHAATSALEHQVINRVAQGLAHGEFAVAIPPDMQADAYKVYCDEGYHAWFCYAQIREVEAATGIPFVPRGLPPFLRRLRQSQAAVAPEVAPLVEVCFAVVAETLITGALAGLAHDVRVVSTVREVMADHARDEARHHAYFASLFTVVWPQLAPHHQRLIGPLLPQFILGFVEPHYAVLRQLLAKYGVSSLLSAQVLAEAYPAERVGAEAQHVAHATLRLLARHGVFDEPQTAEAFYTSGLLPLQESKLPEREAPAASLAL